MIHILHIKLLKNIIIHHGFMMDHVPWKIMETWVITTIEHQHQHQQEDWKKKEYEVTHSIQEDYTMNYRYMNCYNLASISCTKNGRLYFRYLYDDDEVELKVEFVPRIFKELRAQCATVHPCQECREYHDLIVPEEGGTASYCLSCYPHVVASGVYGVCDFCHTDKSGVWAWTTCGHLFHNYCIRSRDRTTLYCPVEECGKITFHCTYDYV